MRFGPREWLLARLESLRWAVGEGCNSLRACGYCLALILALRLPAVTATLRRCGVALEPADCVGGTAGLGTFRFTHDRFNPDQRLLASRAGRMV